MQMEYWMFARILADQPVDVIEKRDYMTLISLDHLGIDEHQERKDNFQKDMNSSIEQKISKFIFSTDFYLVYKFGIKGIGISFFNDLQSKNTHLISRLIYEKLHKMTYQQQNFKKD